MNCIIILFPLLLQAIVVFIACVLCVTLSTLSAAFAFLSGAVCAGADITFHSRKGNVRTKLDVKQYCLPRETENKVMGFVDGVICVLLAVWCIFGCIFFCCDGRYLGIKSRRRVWIAVHIIFVKLIVKKIDICLDDDNAIKWVTTLHWRRVLLNFKIMYFLCGST